VVKEQYKLKLPNDTLEILQNAPQGSVLLGAISYGKLSLAGQEGEESSQKNPVSYQISYVVPPNKVAYMSLFFGPYKSFYEDLKKMPAIVLIAN
jgi:tripeptidyl-peptidase-2